MRVALALICSVVMKEHTKPIKTLFSRMLMDRDPGMKSLQLLLTWNRTIAIKEITAGVLRTALSFLHECLWGTNLCESFEF